MEIENVVSTRHGWKATIDGQRMSGHKKSDNPYWAEIVAQGLEPAEWADPRTPQQIYDEQVLAPLDAQVLKDAARMVEDFYDALVDQLPQSMKDKHGPLMAERKTKRSARP